MSGRSSERFQSQTASRRLELNWSSETKRAPSWCSPNANTSMHSESWVCFALAKAVTRRRDDCFRNTPSGFLEIDAVRHSTMSIETSRPNTTAYRSSTWMRFSIAGRNTRCPRWRFSPTRATSIGVVRETPPPRLHGFFGRAKSRRRERCPRSPLGTGSRS